LALSSEKSHAQIARDLGLKETSLYAWISQYRGEVLGTNHDMTAEQELAALKKEVARLLMLSNLTLFGCIWPLLLTFIQGILLVSN